jgi:DNA-binding NarL/FixJ family response regulator
MIIRCSGMACGRLWTRKTVFTVLGEAGDGETALKMIKTLRPAIAILDVAMPGLDGLALARHLQDDKSAVKIILITMYREERLFKEAVIAGIKGYVLKDSAATDIISCIKAVVDGQNYTSPEFTTYLVSPRQRSGTGLTPFRAGGFDDHRTPSAVIDRRIQDQ